MLNRKYEFEESHNSVYGKCGVSTIDSSVRDLAVSTYYASLIDFMYSAYFKYTFNTFIIVERSENEIRYCPRLTSIG